MSKDRAIPLNCYICGRFIGKDGYPDVTNDGREEGYSMCARCGIKNGYTPKDNRKEKDEIYSNKSICLKYRQCGRYEDWSEKKHAMYVEKL